jgi:hypothetical protein
MMQQQIPTSFRQSEILKPIKERIVIWHLAQNRLKIEDSEHDMPPLFVLIFKLEFGPYFLLKTITKMDQRVKTL